MRLLIFRVRSRWAAQSAAWKIRPVPDTYDTIRKQAATENVTTPRYSSLHSLFYPNPFLNSF